MKSDMMFIAAAALALALVYLAVRLNGGLPDWIMRGESWGPGQI